MNAKLPKCSEKSKKFDFLEHKDLKSAIKIFF